MGRMLSYASPKNFLRLARALIPLSALLTVRFSPQASISHGLSPRRIISKARRSGSCICMFPRLGSQC